MKLKSKSNINKRKKKSLQNNSMSKDINLTIGELIMNSEEEYRIKKEMKSLMERKKNKEYGLPNINQNWQMSLRRNKNFIDSRNDLINFGSQKYPYWVFPTEKCPKYDEYITKPKKEFNYSSYGNLSSRTNSIQNFFNLELKKNKTNDDIFKNYFKKNGKYETLEIQGQKLIDFEENLYKKLRGKKKILKVKNNKEEVKDITFRTDYSNNNFKFLK